MILILYGKDQLRTKYCVITINQPNYDLDNWLTEILTKKIVVTTL